MRINVRIYLGRTRFAEERSNRFSCTSQISGNQEQKVHVSWFFRGEVVNYLSFQYPPDPALISL